MTSGTEHIRSLVRLTRLGDAARRLREVIRSNIAHGRYASGRVPDEAELMREHHASRAVVREALAQLQDIGLIRRVQGLGTFAVNQMPVTPLVKPPEAPQADFGMWSETLRPDTIDRSVVPIPDAVAAHMPGAGPECLRLDYVQHFDDKPIGLGTLYVRFPEAFAVSEIHLDTDVYALLESANIHVGKSLFLIGSTTLDEMSARRYHVPQGSAVLTIERVMYDLDDRPVLVSLATSRAEYSMVMPRNA